MGSPPKREADRVPSPPPALAGGSLALLVLGGALLARDIGTQTLRAAGWIAFVGGAVGLLVAGLWWGLRRAPAPPALPRRRRLAHGGILVALLLQLAVPVTYYVGDDPYDERFSWRMFSAVRVQRCRLRAAERVDGRLREIALREELHVAWTGLLRRNREAVMERFLDWRCRRPGVEEVRLDNVCVGPDGEAVPPVRRVRECRP